MRHRASVANDFALLAKLFAATDGSWGQAAMLATAIKAPERVVAICKAAVGAGISTDPAWAGALSPYQTVTTQFIESLRSLSIFVRLLDLGMVEAPLRANLVGASGGFAASVTGEGGAVALSKLSLTVGNLEMHRAAGIAVFSTELLSNSSPAALAFVDHELRKAVSGALDLSLLALITDGDIDEVPATGADAEGALQDLRSLLDIVNTTGGGALAWLVSPDVANRAATLAGIAGQAFPGMSPQGGEMLNLPALVSTAVAAGTILLVEATGLVGGIESISLSMSSAAAVQMLDAPTNSGVTPTATALVSLWQTNSRAIKADCFHGATRGREGTVAKLTGIAWGDTDPES